MGKLQKYNDAVAVEEALDKGKAAHEALGGHTVKSDVPEGAKFTDTVYNDTAVKAGILSVNEKISSLTLGLHTDGLFYIFLDGEPIGNGISLPEAYGDIYGNVDSENNIVLNGDLADGNYFIKYEMSDGSTIDIGDLVIDSNVYYSVANDLTNCTNSNSDTSIAEGGSYSATITANSGYGISSIVVTMGGTDITASAVSGGNISIASVTGNIVITAVAEQATVEVTNWIEEVGYTTDTRLSLSSGSTTTASGYECTGFIPVKIHDVVRIKNIDLTDENATNFVVFDADKNPINGGASTYGNKLYTLFVTNGTESGGVYTADLNSSVHNALNSNMAYIRISSKSITDESVLTVNQKIV